MPTVRVYCVALAFEEHQGKIKSGKSQTHGVEIKESAEEERREVKQERERERE